jgi:hypothetical protein
VTVNDERDVCGDREKIVDKKRGGEYIWRLSPNPHQLYDKQRRFHNI